LIDRLTDLTSSKKNRAETAKETYIVGARVGRVLGPLRPSGAIMSGDAHGTERYFSGTILKVAMEASPVGERVSQADSRAVKVMM
jgi:hypothetical protein